MNRNSESHYSQVPQVDIQRSRFDRSYQHKTTFNTGDLIPIFCDEVLPGDTFQITQASALRMSTPVYPVMDNCFADYYYFFVPNRLLWEHWKQFMGENTESKWAPQIEYQVPVIKAPTGGWQKGTLADYLTVPTLTDNIEVNALPFRAIGLIINEWFRDQNLKDPCFVNMDDTNVTGSNGSTYQTDVQLGGKPFKAAKVHDYFTSCLPEPQKGASVMLPLGKDAPIISGEEHKLMKSVVKVVDPNGNSLNSKVIGTGGTGSMTAGNLSGLTGGVGAMFSNLYADLNEATAATINQLRQAFAVQRLLEKDARGGSRYREIIRNHFQVVSPDARMNIPEYIGGYRQPINISQVVQTSATDSVSPQGNTAAFSLTNGVKEVVTYSSTEHGWILGFCVVRTDHTYQQGIERMFSRKNRYDYYWPSLANIGEMGVKNKEIYASGTSADDEIFGYQEAWGDMRFHNSHVTGAFRSNYQTSLDSWHYADYYTTQPILGSDWIDETHVNMDRTLAVNSSIEDQFLADFYFDVKCTRPMPVFSVPGLIDHH